MLTGLCDTVLPACCNQLGCLPLHLSAARLSSVHQWIGISPDDLTAGGKAALEAVSQIAADLRVKDPSLTRWAAVHACPLLSH